MLNAIQESKRCNRLVMIPLGTPFHSKNGDHFGVESGII